MDSDISEMVSDAITSFMKEAMASGPMEEMRKTAFAVLDHLADRVQAGTLDVERDDTATIIKAIDDYMLTQGVEAESLDDQDNEIMAESARQMIKAVLRKRKAEAMLGITGSRTNAKPGQPKGVFQA